MQGKPVRLIADGLLVELLHTAHAAMEGTDLLLAAPWWCPEPSQAARPAGESSGAASDQLPGVAPAGRLESKRLAHSFCSSSSEASASSSEGSSPWSLTSTGSSAASVLLSSTSVMTLS